MGAVDISQGTCQEMFAAEDPLGNKTNFTLRFVFKQVHLGFQPCELNQSNTHLIIKNGVEKLYQWSRNLQVLSTNY